MQEQVTNFAFPFSADFADSANVLSIKCIQVWVLSVAKYSRCICYSSAPYASSFHSRGKRNDRLATVAAQDAGVDARA